MQIGSTPRRSASATQGPGRHRTPGQTSTALLGTAWRCRRAVCVCVSSPRTITSPMHPCTHALRAPHPFIHIALCLQIAHDIALCTKAHSKLEFLSMVLHATHAAHPSGYLRHMRKCRGVCTSCHVGQVSSQRSATTSSHVKSCVQASAIHRASREGSVCTEQPRTSCHVKSGGERAG